MSIRISNVNKSFGDFAALTDVPADPRLAVARTVRVR